MASGLVVRHCRMTFGALARQANPRDIVGMDKCYRRSCAGRLSNRRRYGYPVPFGGCPVMIAYKAIQLMPRSGSVWLLASSSWLAPAFRLSRNVELESAPLVWLRRSLFVSGYTDFKPR
jgi:hypothetical protein